MKKNEDDYKISVTSPQILKMPQYFKTFYSGGPVPISHKDESLVEKARVFILKVLFLGTYRSFEENF